MKNWLMEFPQKAFENEARRAPLAAQERVTRSGCHFARSQTPFNWDLLGKNLNALLAVDWIETVRWFSDILDRTETSRMIVGVGLFNLGLGVHDKGTARDDRLMQWTTGME